MFLVLKCQCILLKVYQIYFVFFVNPNYLDKSSFKLCICFLVLSNAKEPTDSADIGNIAT